MFAKWRPGPQTNVVTHPAAIRKRKGRKSKFRRELEVVMRWAAWGLSICNLPALIPQIWVVWHGQIDGANPITWGYLSIAALIWTTYGFTSRDPRLILNRAGDLIGRGLIFLGILWWKFLGGQS